jgi:hypothetical protein
MKKDIIYAVILLVIYFALTCLITLVNSSLTTLGIYFYLPGLFFLSSSLFFDTTKSFIICLLIGIFLDTALETPFGFHAITLPLFQIIGNKWLKYSGNKNIYRHAFFQFLSNILISILLLLFFILFTKNQISIPKFILDIILSALIFLPVCLWFQSLLTSIFFDDSKIEKV